MATVKRLLLVAFLSTAVFSAGVVPSDGANSKDLEYKIKAAYLYNFARFVEWPSFSIEERKGPIVIGILGNAPGIDTVMRALAQKTIGSISITTRTIDTLDEARNCMILFIPSSAADKGAPMIRALQGSPVLTVGESSDFLTNGGMINFAVEKNSIRFDVNMPAVDRAGIKISSQMLQFARTAG